MLLKLKGIKKYFPIKKSEYKKALKIAQMILKWVNQVMKEENKYYRKSH